MRFEEDTRPGSRSPVQIWEKPSASLDYVIGADVAEGLEHGDYSDASVLCIQTGVLVAKWHGHIDPDLFGIELGKLGRYYNTALIGCESNMHGLTTLTALRNTGYPRIFRQRTVDEVTNKITMKWGWATTSKTKPLMIDELGAALRDGSIEVKDSHTLAELMSYVRDERGRMAGSPHDDRVISLAIAVQMLKFAHDRQYQSKKDAPRWSFSWWFDKARSEEAQPSFVIGKHNHRK